ncbi:MAG: BT_3928 family protein [Patiriisocius sp.]|uniref:BT_3928 family protein n=1 Tax=Patiriisocius sp. TaxID=2822396 RepID=UPI003EF7C49E
MKVLIGFARIFVGILFIISGLIKLNDPVGFSFKLGDYFAPEVLNLEFLVPYALLIAVVVVIFEVLLGVMLIIGYAKKFTLWSLLILIVGFTFLTFYSAYFNKVTDCGCFGDALKLTPWQSFYKDVVLLVLILILFAGRKHIQPFFAKFTRTIIVFVAFILCMWLGYHVLSHLPVVDFRAYKVGANIKEGMETPPDALPPLIQYNWEYEVNGKSQIIVNTTGQDPQLEGGKMVGVTTEFLREPYEPPVHDFSIEREGEDFTEEFLAEDNLIAIIAYNLDNTEKDGFLPIRKITNEAIKNGYKVIGLSASSQEETEKLVEFYDLNFKFYFCDMTTLKTIVRSNPGIVSLEKGTVVQKLHFNDAEDLRLKQLDNATPNLDFDLKKRLDSIAVLDQKYRMLMQNEGANMDSLWRMQSVIDASNIQFVSTYFDTKGYPGKTVVGEPTNTAAWYVLQHNPDKIPEYLPMIKKAGEAEEIPFRLVAMMEDRYLMGEEKPQIYGTQGSTMADGTHYIWPIENPKTVNERRLKAGYTQTIEEYGKLLFGEDFEYKALTMDDIKK